MYHTDHQKILEYMLFSYSATFEEKYKFSGTYKVSSSWKVKKKKSQLKCSIQEYGDISYHGEYHEGIHLRHAHKQGLVEGHQHSNQQVRQYFHVLVLIP